jgi:hypothetical protein
MLFWKCSKIVLIDPYPFKVQVGFKIMPPSEKSVDTANLPHQQGQGEEEEGRAMV